eukprot:COSAG02_NODE_13469_length_1390_cov_2.680868_1_plen_282_part_10
MGTPVFNGLPSQHVNRSRSPRRAAQDRVGFLCRPYPLSTDMDDLKAVVPLMFVGQVHDDFVHIDERHKDDHHDDVNDHLMRIRQRDSVVPPLPPPSPPRTVIVPDPRLEEDLRTMQERLAEEHRAREDERRRAEELLRALDRQRPDTERQRVQNEELQSKLRSEHRMAEEIKSEKEQLRQQVAELEVSLADARAAADEAPALRRRLASLESDLATERSARKQAELQWSDQLSAHKQRLTHSIESTQRTMAEREAHLEAEAKRLQAELQRMSEACRIERAEHA